MKFLKKTLATLGLVALSLNVSMASDYPTKPVTLVIGFSAGGPTDIVGRYLAQKLSDELGQSVVVENRAGATGVIALQSVKKASPDGYTLMLGSSSTLSIEPIYKKKVQYDVLKELTPIGLVASYPYVLVVPESSPFKTVGELIAAAKKDPGKLVFASAGNGAVNHLAGEWFKSETGADITHVPYRGDSAAVADLIAGRIDMAFLSIIAADPQVESKKMRVLAIASENASPLKPNLKTVAEEANIEGFSAEPWNGVLGPAGMPKDVVEKLNKAITKVMNTDEAKARLFSLGQIPFTGTPEEFTNHIVSQTERWDAVIKNAKIEKAD